jgi:hypothetical protein
MTLVQKNIFSRNCQSVKINMVKLLSVLSLMLKLFIISTAMVFSCELNATSCAPTKDRVFAQCNVGICTSFLYVREVTSYSQCSRRPVIEKPPEWAKEVFEFEIQQNKFTAENGVYELLLEGSLWSQSYIFSNAEKYRLYSEDSKKQGRPIATLGLSVSHSIEELRVEWKSKEKKEYKKMVLFKVLDWLSLFVISVLLVYSVIWFHKWQKALLSIKWMYLSISVQLLICVILFVSENIFTMPLVILLTVFIPGLWLYQIVSCVNSWWIKRSGS